MRDNEKDKAMSYTITDPASPHVQAVFIRAHLRMVAVGGQPRAPLTRGGLLNKAANLTGKPYGRGEYKAAIADLTALLESLDKGNDHGG